MFYREALDFIRNIERAGSDYGIERMREFLLLLGEPDRKLKIVHVAGTNGKGSVCAFLTSVLVAAGYKTGTYNSPSVLDYNERFLIDGKPLSDGDVAKYMTVVREAAEKENARRAALYSADECASARERTFCPTAFELETALALVAFADKGCEACVLETGLGGRWDATNAVAEKELAVITKIGLDHCALLGNTYAEIAAEKADIIRDAAVTCVQENGAAEVLASKGAVVAAEAQGTGKSLEGQRFVWKGKPYEIGLKGRHQLVNAALALEALQKLSEKGWHIDEKAVREGMKRAVWHVRFEVLDGDNIVDSPYDVNIPKDKLLVLDGAHNPQGALALKESLEEYLHGADIIGVQGMFADKDFGSVCATLSPLMRKIYCVTPPSPRALPAEELAKAVVSCDGAPETVTAQSVREGIERAFADGCDCAVVYGSLSLFGQLARQRAGRT